EIKAIVTDSTYADFPEMIIQYYGNFGPFKYLLGILPKLLGNLFLKGGLSRLSPENIIGSVMTPLLIIHSSNDPFVPVTHARRLYEKANQPKELLILPGATHGVGPGSEYQERITAFFKKYLVLKTS
ncbi:MAG: prolyl oligopeptidase family serine peptidase, partial [Candidatus Omnitrophica bacterium]|nr:prolyl oligopeptidase family serine peptidase [Candidatus Omnitrophota bacterium]